MEKIFLGLGSNVGDRKSYIKKAIFFLKQKIKNIKSAPIYKSRAYGFKNQEYFLNTAVSGYTDLPPEELLKFIKDVEKKVGRVYRFHWGPREIDIDILFYGDLIYKSDNLVIPHPYIHERDFVLKPLCDLECNFKHPELNKTIYQLLKEIKENFIFEK